MPLTRRSWLEIACAALASFRATASPRIPAVSGMTALTHRAHFLAPPGVRRELIECFETVLGCGRPIALAAPGKSEPILAFRFPGGGSVSVEFTSEALAEASARRGAWLEVRPRDPAGPRSGPAPSSLLGDQDLLFRRSRWPGVWSVSVRRAALSPCGLGAL